jgi:lysozyme
MKMSKNGIDLIKQFESFRSKPYLCSAGKATIGYGSTFYLDGTPVKLTDKEINETDAVALLQKVANDFVEQVMKAVKVSLTQNEVDAIACFTYNVGVKAFSDSTMLKKLNKGDKQGASLEYMRWNKAGGKELKGLTRRREAEQKLFLTPDTATPDPLLASATLKKEDFDPIV